MRIIIITGPTASGKSTFALHLAQQMNGEIISADSMQIYRECDIATAKPTVQEQQLVPHHLIDIIDPTVRFSAAMWADAARHVIAQIRERGKTPIVVGGTGFYLQALLKPHSLAQVPPNPALREQLQKLTEADLWDKLQQLDPQAAARLDPHNTKRVIRAIEVAQGEKVLLPPLPEIPYVAFGLEWPRELLYERINARVDEMMAQGLMDELRYLVNKYGSDAPALDGIGYKEMLPVLEDAALQSAQIELWKRATRRYAKRQMTWFRHQLEVEWLDAAELAGNNAERNTENVVRQIAERYSHDEIR